jgi:ribose 5-phosphate isomerase A
MDGERMSVTLRGGATMGKAESTDEIIDKEKELVARKSLELIQDGMVVGLGTGTTARHFIKLLGQRVKEGLRIRGIASSKASRELADSLGIPLTNFENCQVIDVAVDGADEIGPGLALIKGGGGALLLEKIVASASKKFVVIADARKVVARLGKVPLPVEVVREAHPLVARRLMEIGIPSKLRQLESGASFVTDEGNVILDCECGEIEDPDALAASIRRIVGVVEHGLFLHMAQCALVADASGAVRTLLP